jgi:hypothetical protein
VGMAPLGLLSPLNHQFLVVQPVLSMEIKFPISICDVDLESVEWSRQWIQRMGDQVLPVVNQ